jgi:hypothetical protein
MSTRPAFLGLALLGSALAAVISLELQGTQPGEDDTGIVAIRHAPRTAPHAASEDPQDRTDAWVSVALARPLFSRDRRPTPVVAKSDSGPTLAALPRLTGIIVGPFGRTAIFAATEGGKPTAVREGQALGPYTIRSVGPGGVTVDGPEGEQHVALTGDADTRRQLAAEIPQPVQPQVQPTLPPGVLPGTVQGRALPGAPGVPFGAQQRQNLLNLRPGLQFQRGQGAIPGVQPNQEGSN